MTVEQIMLTPEFQELIANDELLNELERERISPADTMLELVTYLTGEYDYNGLKLKALTALDWVLLVSYENSFTTDKLPTEMDVDLMLYLLTHTVDVRDNLPELSMDYCKTLGINWQQMIIPLKQIIYIAHRPLEMLPVKNAGEEVRFDAQWLASLVAIVHKVTGETPTKIIKEMPLTAVYLYLIEQAKTVEQNISRKGKDQINEAIYNRTYELGKQLLKQKEENHG